MSPSEQKPADAGTYLIDSPYAWFRLVVALLISTVGGTGLWSVVVTLPYVEADFGTARGDASVPYMLTMFGFATGTIVMGRIVDKFGIVFPIASGAIFIGAGYIGASMADSIWTYAIIHGVCIGFLGSSSTFSPIIADISLWFERRRGMAIAIVASGNYLAGTIWPPVVEGLTEAFGWRDAHFILGIICVSLILPLSWFMRRRPPLHHATGASSAVSAHETPHTMAMNLNVTQVLLIIAGIACCIAMSMPQVHIVAYCVDLGFGSDNGARMLSSMLFFGIISRLFFGWLSDHIGALKTLLIGSALQGLTLALFIPFDGLMSLYIVSALFGLAQGGIVPTYAMIVRLFFPASQAGTRVGIVLSSTMAGMAIGGWLTGAIYDLTLSYDAAFLNGIGWNILNLVIASFLLWRFTRPRLQPA